MPCPYCGENIRTSASKCRHCGEWLHGKTRESVAAIAPPPATAVASTEAEAEMIATKAVLGGFTVGRAKKEAAK